MNREKEVWSHYRDYVIEATHRAETELENVLGGMKTRVAGGCSLEELKEMMLEVFEPITIMQALEQWQNQMDIMLSTKLDSLGGKSREEYYLHSKNKSPYDFGIDALVDCPDSDTHIYDLSGITQNIIHMTSEGAGIHAPKLLKHMQQESGLEENFEIQMLLGDCYRKIGEFDKALEVYSELAEKNGYQDPSIQDAITFTKYVMKIGPKLKEKRMEDLMDDYHDFKNQETFRRPSPKISRNDPCPCGSGKKYKHCCGKNA